MNLTVCKDGADLARQAADAFVEAAAAGDRPALCLTGGSTPQAMHRLLASPEYAGRVDWPRLNVFFGDERKVPLDDPRSNYHAAREALLEHVPVDPARVHPITDADQYEWEAHRRDRGDRGDQGDQPVPTGDSPDVSPDVSPGASDDVSDSCALAAR